MRGRLKTPRSRSGRNSSGGTCAVLVLIALALGCGDDGSVSGAPTGDDAASVAVEPAPTVVVSDRPTMDDFVGAARCAACHRAEAELWRGSHHDDAMATPSSATVLGDFGSDPIAHGDAAWSFERTDDGWFVRHADDAGTVDRRRVLATFGVSPLQQLLVEGTGGRWQAWPIAWDARAPEAGGQRWFALAEDEGRLLPDDPMHRDGVAWNWNTQCASCHSTALRKAYDDERDVFSTVSAELDVACEACHGPGRRHAERAEAGEAAGADLVVHFDPWRMEDWRRGPDEPIARRVVSRAHDRELDVCGPCHARRTAFADPAPIGAPFLDGFAPRAIEPGLYFDDGGIRDEVYVWGSFQQSRMAAAGVRCSDCHEPHSLAARRPGNALCTGCHAPGVYDAANHRGHGQQPDAAGGPAPGTGAACVDCHMPSRTYMGVDERRDHAFGLPRPARSAALGRRDACLACHADRSVPWAEEVIAAWRGERAPAPHWADRLVRDGVARTDAERWLEIAGDAEATPFVRGSAWRRYADEASRLPPVGLLASRVRDASPLERLGLVEVARRMSPGERARLLAPLLAAPTRAVRLAAAEVLSEDGGASLRTPDRSALARVLREYRAAQQANAERPEAQTNLALMAARAGEIEQARGRLERAVERAPYFVPARVNLADLARVMGDEAVALAQLEEAVRRVPTDARVRRAYGFALHRSGDREGALEALGRARRDAPEDPEGALAYALALDGAGDRAAATAELSEALAAGLDAPDLHHAYVSFTLEAGQFERARSAFETWRSAHPGDPRLAAFAARFRRGPTG